MMTSKTKKQIEWTNWIQHELKTPLNRMESLVDSLNKQSDLDFEGQKKLLKLKDALAETKSILDSLYLFNKIEQGLITPHIVQKDINPIIMTAVQDSEVLAKLKGVSFMVETEPLFPIKIDEQLFRQAFLNILENAIKFSPSETRVLLSTEEVEGFVVIQIADQGLGMSEEALAKIFDPYFRAEETAHKPGTGLGLYIARRFIEFHGGEIEVDSIENQGSTFTIKLPKV